MLMVFCWGKQVGCFPEVDTVERLRQICEGAFYRSRRRREGVLLKQRPDRTGDSDGGAFAKRACAGPPYTVHDALVLVRPTLCTTRLCGSALHCAGPPYSVHLSSICLDSADSG